MLLEDLIPVEHNVLRPELGDGAVKLPPVHVAVTGAVVEQEARFRLDRRVIAFTERCHNKQPVHPAPPLRLCWHQYSTGVCRSQIKRPGHVAGAFAVIF